MKIRSEKGITNIDYVVAIIIFMIGSVAVLGLYYNMYKTMSKIKIDETIIGYITEICEDIDLENYRDVDTEEEINQIIRSANIPEQYLVECIGIEKQNDTNEALDVVQKINIKVSYSYGDSNREYVIKKVKVKE